MCTIGNAFYKYNGRSIVNSYFKQCDLVDATTFNSPQIASSSSGIRYVAMTRNKPDGTEPAWAGVNEYGVSFVAADSYLDDGKEKEVGSAKAGEPSVFDMYLSTITDCKTAEEAKDKALNFYKTFSDPDIFMVGDGTTAYFIESYGGKVSCIERKDGHFASANHFRMIHGAVPYRSNHSTYLRLERAEQILQSKPDLDGIGDVLRDKYYGETLWSVCRYAKPHDFDEELYYTQAAVIFSVIPPLPLYTSADFPVVICEYVINGNASQENKGYIWKPFEEGSPLKKVRYIGKLDNLANILK